MHETTELEFALEAEAKRIRDGVEGSPPVVVIAGGTGDGPGATATATAGLDRLREFNGVLETAKYIENGKHFEGPPDDVELPVEDDVTVDL